MEDTDQRVYAGLELSVLGQKVFVAGSLSEASEASGVKEVLLVGGANSVAGEGGEGCRSLSVGPEPSGGDWRWRGEVFGGEDMTATCGSGAEPIAGVVRWIAIPLRRRS